MLSVAPTSGTLLNTINIFKLRVERGSKCTSLPLWFCRGGWQWVVYKVHGISAYYSSNVYSGAAQNPIYDVCFKRHESPITNPISWTQTMWRFKYCSFTFQFFPENPLGERSWPPFAHNASNFLCGNELLKVHVFTYWCPRKAYSSTWWSPWNHGKGSICMVFFPSKLNGDLTNGPLSKLLELFDTQV